jgi:hypothetical protein
VGFDMITEAAFVAYLRTDDLSGGAMKALNSAFQDIISKGLPAAGFSGSLALR